MDDEIENIPEAPPSNDEECSVVNPSSAYPKVLNDHTSLKGRAGHITVRFGRLIIIYGGYMELPSGVEKYHSSNELLVYDTAVKKWFIFHTKGIAPQKHSGSTAVIVGSTLYIFGGVYLAASHSSVDAVHDPCHCVYALNLQKMEWAKLMPSTNVVPSPRHKLVGWHDSGKLFYFGGFGMLPSQAHHPHLSNLQRFGTFSVDNSHPFIGAWNNQLISFDLKTHVWNEVYTSGELPSPRAAHTMEWFGSESIIVFGGRHQQERLNDVFILHIPKMVWQQIRCTGLCPQGRSWTSLAAIDSTNLLLCGGFTTRQDVLSDCWLLNTDTWKWTEMDVVTGLVKPVTWHSAVGFPEDNCVYVYGGCGTNLLNQPPEPIYYNNLVVIRLAAESLKYCCLTALSKKHMQSSTVMLNTAELPLRLTNLIRAFIEPDNFVVDNNITSVLSLLCAL